MGGLNEEREHKNMIVYRCRTVSCPNTVEAPSGLESDAVRLAAESAGWSFVWAPGDRYLGWCGRCGPAQGALMGATLPGCPSCTASALHIALGHGNLEHRIANVLLRIGVDTVEKARGLTPEDVMALPQLGTRAAALLKTRLG